MRAANQLAIASRPYVLRAALTASIFALALAQASLQLVFKLPDIVFAPVATALDAYLPLKTRSGNLITLRSARSLGSVTITNRFRVAVSICWTTIPAPGFNFPEVAKMIGHTAVEFDYSIGSPWNINNIHSMVVICGPFPRENKVHNAQSINDVEHKAMLWQGGYAQSVMFNHIELEPAYCFDGSDANDEVDEREDILALQALLCKPALTEVQTQSSEKLQQTRLAHIADPPVPGQAGDAAHERKIVAFHAAKQVAADEVDRDPQSVSHHLPIDQMYALPEPAADDVPDAGTANPRSATL